MPPTTPRPSAVAPRSTHPAAHAACARDAPRADRAGRRAAPAQELSDGMGQKDAAG